MKKVLFVATVTKHINAFHIPYLKWFKDQGYEVHVASKGNEEIEYCDKHYNLPFERFPLRKNNIKTYKALKKIINENKYEMIHCHTPVGGILTRLAAKKAQKKGTRVIYTAHGFHFYTGAPLLNWIIYYPIEKWMSKYTDTLITINREDYELAKKKLKKCKQIELVNGVGLDTKRLDIEISEKEQDELKKILGIEKNNIVLTYIAELNKNKNQKLLIKTIEQLVKQGENEYILLLVGNGKLKETYEKYVKDKHLEKNIKFLGQRNDIAKILKITDIYVASSLREGLPVNILEAMYMKLPVIAVDNRGHRELIENQDMIIKNNTNLLYEKILNFTKEKTANYRMRCIDKYLLDNVIKEMEQIYFNYNKKILFIRSTSIVNDSRAFKEVNAFLKNGYEVILLCWDREGIFNKDKFNNDKLTYKCFKLKAKYGDGYRKIIKSILYEIWLIINMIKENKKYNIIHACDYDSALPTLILTRFFRKKWVFDIYDYINVGIKEKICISAINRSNLTIVCTEQRKKQIWKGNPQKTLVVYNTPDIEKSKKEFTFSKNGKIKIGYFGILPGKTRLLKEIGETIYKYPNIELHIGGIGELQDYFRNLSKENKNVFFYGSMTYEEVIKLEAKCDILFATYDPNVSNHKFSAPNKVYEAMALGKPIIVCEGTGIDEFVEENEIGYKIKYDTENFFNIINNIDYNQCMIISKKSQKLYNNQYRWSFMEKQMIEEYNNL